MSWMLLIIVGFILIRGLMTGTDVYGAFIMGAERGARAAMKLLPALCGMLLLVQMFSASGLAELLSALLHPVMERMGIPDAVTPLILLRPLTGSGSMAALQEVFTVCGPDSRAGRLAAALVGSSETILYTLTVYAGSAGIRRVPGALAASLAGYAAGIAVCLLIIH